MNPRNLILMVLAAAGVILVVLLTRSFLSNAQQKGQPAAESTRVAEAKILVAKRDLHVGTILKPEDITWQAWPEKGVSEAYFKSGTDKAQTLNGKVVRVPLTKGEPVTRSSIVAQGDRGFMAAILGTGMRAVTIKLSATSGIGGFVFPGDRVDVILSHALEVSRSEKYQIAETVFQNVRVLAVDQKSSSDDKAKVAKTATIEVTPKMAEKVAMLSNLGGLTLSLRSLANNGNSPSSNPNSPPVSETASHTMGDEISKFLPALDDDSTIDSVRVARGNTASHVNIGRGKKQSGQGSDT